MADQKISELSDGGAPLDTDQLVIARSGSSLSLLFSAVKAAIPGGVASVFGRTGAVVAANGDYTAAQVGALPSTETLDQIATANVTAADWSNNSKKITSLANGSGAQDAAAFGQIPTALPPSGSAGGDLTGTYPNPTIGAAKVTIAKFAAAVTLDAIAAANATAAAVAMNAKKITGLANGSASDDAAAFGQIPTTLPPNGSAGGDLSGTYPNPAVKAITETSGPTDLTIGTITDGQFLKRSGSTLVSGSAGSLDQYANTYITVADETIPANAEVIYSEFYELADSFAVELASGAVVQVGTSPALPQPAMVKLFSVTLGSDMLNLDTGPNAIPAGYSTLEVVMRVKTSRAAGWPDDMKMTFNGDTGSNYDYQITFMGSSASFSQAHGAAFIGFTALGANTSTQNYLSAVRMTIPGYANTSFWKTCEGTSGGIDTGNTQQFSETFQGGWESTAAINQITVTSSNAATNIKAGSSITVYGMI